MEKQKTADLQAKHKNFSVRLRPRRTPDGFHVLYGKRCRQLHIGYNHTTGEFSSSYYDMLMSEAV